MAPKPAARLLHADVHNLLADGIKSVLEPNFQVLDIVTDGCSLLQSAAALKPDVIVPTLPCHV
ncbi:MAG TPA: hypothetical protein VMU45_07710 [Candidatus Eisenbacteria bacterium]|nr:hypothetical protein [Candidatus Eisenbacteria bacterium]